MTLHDFLAQTKTGAQWQRIGIRSHHGICLPLFSLRTERSAGIGDFGDLLPLIDWCKKTGFDGIQLLPLNDSGDDPSPYNALSSCALNPIHLSLSDLPDAQFDRTLFTALNHAPRVLYDQVRLLKHQWLWNYFHRTFSTVKNSLLYRNFLAENSWLKHYALFKVCKDETNHASWEEWEPSQQSPATCKVKDPNGLDFYCFLQFLAFQQLERVKRTAEENGLFLKGDIPILISPDSVDVWAHRSLFNLRYGAGAPPDYYNKDGQNWGFPLFNWDEMRKNNFAWWKMRLQVAERFYHIYRIDHVVGFFRIWAIPQNKSAVQGKFLPEDENLWGSQGRELLEMMIGASSMLPMAEDLGTIPPVVYTTLREFGICGTKVLRWQRRWDGDRGYIPFEEYEPISLTTVSTPDSGTLESWWKKFPDDARPFAEFKHWIYESQLSSDQRQSILFDAHHTASLFHINQLQEYLALFPALVAPRPEEERVNVPGSILPTNWTYRFRPSLEEIISHFDLTEIIRKIL